MRVVGCVSERVYLLGTAEGNVSASININVSTCSFTGLRCEPISARDFGACWKAAVNARADANIGACSNTNVDSRFSVSSGVIVFESAWAHADTHASAHAGAQAGRDAVVTVTWVC